MCRKGARVVMISLLVQSAFQTGCLSVESEGLIRQVLTIKGYQTTDLEALERLCEAVNSGYIQREAFRTVDKVSVEPSSQFSLFSHS